MRAGYLTKNEHGLHTHYKYGYGPGGSLIKRIWGKTLELLTLLALVSMPLLVILGIYQLIRAIF